MAGAPSTAVANLHQQPAGKVDALTLCDLAPELIERIAEHTDGASLRALRLTCRNIAARIFRAYCKANFASRTILLCDRQSISNAAKAAEHEVFGRYLHRFTVVIDDIYNLDRHLPKELCAVCDSTRKFYSPRSRNRDLRLLFQRMRIPSRLVELKLVDSSQVPEGRCSILDDCRTSCSRVFLGPPMDIGDRQLGVLLRAARKSDVKIARLSILAKNWAVNIHSSFIRGSRAQSLGFALQHMRLLEVPLGPSRSNRDREAAIEFFDMVCSAPKLESLKLRLKEGPGDSRPVFDGRLLHRSMLQLKEFHLVGASVLMHDLQQLVSLNSKLQKVNLTRVDFMRGSFSDDVLGDFHITDAEDIHGPARKLIVLPGHYEDLWSDDVALV
ncbi:hypothetical protein CBER1_10688 [Cercospora berteroae]|uniref:F-box domain-containing protein n=1 Tax=Cercospora berteroae TaxID=357750 RepID=A0A2S6CJM1_9PEZI|nr:hypothetical protein CBER1_10688 [Cercospora berteroae]